MAQLPINRLLHNSSFGPQEVSVLRAAFYEIMAALANPLKPKVPAYLSEIVARKVVAVGQTGERDRALLVERVFEEIGIERPRAVRRQR